MKPKQPSNIQLARVRKAYAYVTREGARGRELLVYSQLGHPELGLRVPGGTVERGEALEAAMLRELQEETGLKGFTMLGEVACYDWYNPTRNKINERHIFHLLAPATAPDTWDWTETDGGALPRNEWALFRYSWLELASEIVLARDLGSRLDALRNS